MTSRPGSVAILTQYFHPEVPGTAQIATDLAIGLTEKGFAVSVYTGQPAWDKSERLPGREVHRGVEINRAFSRKLSRDGQGSRLSNGVSVAVSTLLKMLTRKKPDVMLVDSTSPFLMTVTWVLSKLRGVPYGVIVHDVYPEIAITVGVVGEKSMYARVWRAVYRRVYRSASRVVVLGRHMGQVVGSSLPNVQADKLIEIPNWADGDAIVPRSSDENPMRQELGLAKKLVVMYSGNMGVSHDMETLVDAADRLRDRDGVRFLFIGEGGRKDMVADLVRTKRLDNVTLLPYQPVERLPISLTCGDISLVTLERGMEGLSVPSKVYSSLAAGLAVIAVMGSNSEISDIIESHRCGYRVDQGDTDALVQAITTLEEDRHLLADMKQRARDGFDSGYSRELGVERYASMLDEILEQTHA